MMIIIIVVVWQARNYLSEGINLEEVVGLLCCCSRDYPRQKYITASLSFVERKNAIARTCIRTTPRVNMRQQWPTIGTFNWRQKPLRKNVV